MRPPQRRRASHFLRRNARCASHSSPECQGRVRGSPGRYWLPRRAVAIRRPARAHRRCRCALGVHRRGACFDFHPVPPCSFLPLLGAVKYRLDPERATLSHPVTCAQASARSACSDGRHGFGFRGDDGLGAMPSFPRSLQPSRRHRKGRRRRLLRCSDRLQGSEGHLRTHIGCSVVQRCIADK